MADLPAHDFDTERPRTRGEPGPAGLARLLHRVLPEHGDPALQAYRPPPDALGEEEVQATGTQRQASTRMAARSPGTGTGPVRALGAAVLKPWGLDGTSRMNREGAPSNPAPDRPRRGQRFGRR